MIKRTADASWDGDLKSGKGAIKLGSGAFEGPYSFGTRFEQAKGTNPEELLGAAHAACFTMALSLALEKAGYSGQKVDTTATVQLDKVGAGFSIVGIALVTRGRVTGITPEEFRRLADETKSGCIISRALAGVPMTIDAALA